MVPSFNFIPAWLIFKQPLGARAAAALRAATALVPKGTPSFHTASRHANRVDGSADNRTTPFSRRTSASITCRHSRLLALRIMPFLSVCQVP